MKSITMTTIVASLLLAGTVLADIINVPGDYPTIQGAVDAAIDGDEIVVAPGTYIGSGDSVVTIVDKTLVIKSSGSPNDTLIDGEGVRRCLYADGDYVVVGVIEGFSFINGMSTSYGGGAAYVKQWKNYNIRNCVFRDNSCFGTGYSHSGGAICTDSAVVVIEGCQFINNNAEYGGGAVGIYRTGTVLRDCLFEGNQSTFGKGGAVYNHRQIDIVSCVFRDNLAMEGGALFNDWYVSISMNNCLFESNQANRGGGIFTRGQCSIDNCVISGNTAAVNGGAIYADIEPELGGSVLLADSIVCNNTEAQIVGPWDDVGGNQISGVCGLGACCISNQAGCVMANEDDCNYFGGSFSDYGVDCADVSCPGGCLGDANGDGEVSVNDILIVIAQWGVTCP